MGRELTGKFPNVPIRTQRGRGDSLSQYDLKLNGNDREETISPLYEGQDDGVFTEKSWLVF